MQVEISRLYNPAGNVEGLVKAGSIIFDKTKERMSGAEMGAERGGQIERGSMRRFNKYEGTIRGACWDDR
jgi:hypothetical protein